MESPIWVALTAAARSAVDSLIQRDHRIAAVARIREAIPVESRPGLYETLDVVAERYRELGKRFERYPTPPLDLETLVEKVGPWQAGQLPSRRSGMVTPMAGTWT